MKILQICPPWYNTPPNGYGGTEWVIDNLSEELIKKGHDVTLFATGESKTSGKLKYIFQKCLRDEEMDIPWSAALPSILHYEQGIEEGNRGKYDIIHLHLSADTDIVILPLIKMLRKPYVITHHSQWPFDKQTNMNEYYLKYYAKGVDVINISKSMGKCIPKEFNEIGVVYNGINLEGMKYNGSPKGDYLTWIGTIEPKKGLKDAILAAKATGNKLIFGGKVDKAYKASYEYFENEIKPLIDGEQIKFLGLVGPDLRNELLGNAKGFLNPINWEEPFGMVMAESMACGTPVISYARGAAVELIQHARTGFLVDNFDEMVEYISRLDSIDRAYCRKHVENNFSKTAMADGYLKVYKRQILFHTAQDIKPWIVTRVKQPVKNVQKKTVAALPKLKNQAKGKLNLK